MLFLRFTLVLTLLLGFLTFPISAPLQALSVLPLSLEQMNEQAEKVFLGKFLSSEEGLDENGMAATFLRFEVVEGYKGVGGQKTILAKQFGRTTTSPSALRVRDGERVLVPMKSLALPAESYAPGRTYLLFFYPESRLGFTSPVGGGQGRMEVIGAANSASEASTLTLEDAKVLWPFHGEELLSDVIRNITEKGAR